MTGIDPEIIMHHLNVDFTKKPVRQRRRKFASERNLIVNNEVEKRVPTLTPLERSDLGVYHIRELTRASKVYQIPVFSVRHLVIYNRTRLHPT